VKEEGGGGGDEQGAAVCATLDGADDFDDVDDESLLEALQSPVIARVAKLQPERVMPPPPRPVLSKVQQAEATAPCAREPTKALSRQQDMPMPPPQKPKPAASHQATANKPPAYFPPATIPSDFDDIGWDFLDSSTQIARELSTEPAVTLESSEAQQATAAPRTATGSFSSGSFDLTEEDLEELDPTPRTKATELGEAAKAADRRKMPSPPPVMAAKRELTNHDQTKTKRQADAPSEMGFTMTQLESFVDDDLQLTQIASDQ